MCGGRTEHDLVSSTEFALGLDHLPPLPLATLAMATIAAQVVLHPAVSQALKFGGTTLGRDKVCPIGPSPHSRVDGQSRRTGPSSISLASLLGISGSRVINSRLHDGLDSKIIWARPESVRGFVSYP